MSANLQIEVTDGVVILGARGSGKSTLLKYLVTTISAVYKVVVFDVIGNLEELKKLDNVAYYRINLVNTKKIDNLLIDIMEHGNMMVALDEADRYKYTKMLSNFTNLGRNFGTGFLAAARRTANLNKDFLANARWAFVFRHILPQDLEVLVEWLDATEEEFRTLKDHEFMIFKDGSPVFKGTLPKGGKAFVSTGKATPASQSQMQSQSPSSQSSISQERKGKSKKLTQNI